MANERVFMELKVVCNCGQKYKFDVEPIQGRMPFVVNCPVCGIDGTPLANGLLSQMPRPAMATPPPIPIAAAAPPPRPAPAAARTAAPQTVATPKYLQDNPATQNNNFALGIVGALVGALVAAALMAGFTMLTGMKFPLLGTVEGLMIGFGARLFYKGTSSTLGAVSAAVAFFTIAGTLFFLFDIFSVLLTGVISLLVGVSMAFKVAS
jgi:hypothetical protein